MNRGFNPYANKVTEDGQKNPCAPDCPKRSATCHANCPDYIPYQQKLQAFGAKQEAIRFGADASFEGMRKNKAMRAKSKSFRY
jgi:hypothetical protein